MPNIEGKLKYDIAALYKPHRANQDAHGHVVNFLNRPGWFFGGVYDGHGDFDAACKEIVRSLPSEFERFLPIAQDTGLSLEQVTSAFERAYEAVSTRIKQDHFQTGAMAANIFIDGSNLYIAHAGDSRVTVYVNDKIVHSTQDHPESGPLSRALGSRRIFKPDVYKLDLIELMREGNVAILLYTDGIRKGLFGELKPEHIATYVNQYSSAQDLAEKVLSIGNEDGIHSLDDRTILVVKPDIEGLERRQKGVTPQEQRLGIAKEKLKKSRFGWLKGLR